jgi:hypothetical protein
MKANVVGKGIQIVAKRCKERWQQSCGPVVLTDLQGKGSIFAVLIFLVTFFIKKKSNSPPRTTIKKH